MSFTMPATPPTNEATRPRDGKRPSAAVSRQPAIGSRPQLFAPLRALLTQRVRLQRRGFQIHIVLEAPPEALAHASADAPAGAPAAPTSGAALRHDHRQLVMLLKRQPDLRHTLRHLGCVEQTLARDGSRALKTMPEKVLHKAVEQLEGLSRDDATFVLPELMLRLRHALASVQERASEFESTEAMDISEASHSLFDEMERSWNGRMPDAK